MEQHRDEPITCASCGSSFTFPAADVAARAERGISSLPTLCKPCWREKRSKSGGPRGGKPRAQGERSAPAQATAAPLERAARRPHAPARYTGDVNEYRSPMPDPHFSSYPSYAPRARGAAPDRGGRFSSGPRGRSFPITCAACGAAATVPFKPIQGQKVYCRTCFQAEKPS